MYCKAFFMRLVLDTVTISKLIQLYVDFSEYNLYIVKMFLLIAIAISVNSLLIFIYL